MNVRLAKKSRKPQRGGFTLIELLVVISIIAVLASLILPAVQNAREAGRRTTCLNNMKQIALAVQNFSTTQNGRIPALVGDIDYYVPGATAGNAYGVPAPWTVQLLPYLDETGVYNILTDISKADTQYSSIVNNSIKTYTCPSSLSADDAGHLSFVANAGYLTSGAWSTSENVHRISSYDWGMGDASSNAKAAASTGVFWRQDSPTTNILAAGDASLKLNSSTVKMTLDRVRDGLTQTIMFSENLHADRWLATPVDSYGAATGDLGFGIPIIQPASGQVQDMNTDTTTIAAVGNATVMGPDHRINSNLNNAGQHTSPRPSSLHPQVVNVFMCDGSGRSLSQQINDTVYARLISSNGNQYEQTPLSGSDF